MFYLQTDNVFVDMITAYPLHPEQDFLLDFTTLYRNVLRNASIYHRDLSPSICLERVLNEPRHRLSHESSIYFLKCSRKSGGFIFRGLMQSNCLVSMVIFLCRPWISFLSFSFVSSRFPERGQGWTALFRFYNHLR